MAWLLSAPSFLLLAVAVTTLGLGGRVGLGAAVITIVVVLAFPTAGNSLGVAAADGLAFSLTTVAAWLVTALLGAGNDMRASPTDDSNGAPDLSDADLRQQIDAVPAQIWSADPNGVPTHINTALAEWAGISMKELREGDSGVLATAINLAIHPDDRLDVATILGEAFRSGHPFALKYRQRHNDGVYRWIDGRAGPLRAPDGTIKQWYGVCFDIDDHVRAHESLHQSERELRHLVDTVPALIWLLTPAGETLDFNQPMADWVGLTPEALQDVKSESCHMTISSLIHPDDSIHAEQAFSRALETGEPLHMRGRLRRKDGEYRWVESRVAPLRDDAGDIVRWYGVSFEIEDEVRAIDALRASEQYLRQVIDTVPVVVFRATGNGKPIYTNRRVEAFPGFQHENLEHPDSPELETAVELLVHPDDREEVERDLVYSFTTGQPFRKRYRQRGEGGRFRWIEGRMEPLRDDAGTIAEWYGVNLDVDDEVNGQEDLLRAQEKLVEASHAASLKELSASIAHEVNQPLAAISANARACHQWLMHEPPNLARARETADAMIGDAEAAANIVSRIRALFSATPVITAPHNLNDIVAEVCRLMASETTRRRARIERDLAADLHHVLIDRVQIQQVLVNLIRNGLEAMESLPVSQRVINIRSVNLDSGAIKIDICDAGPGIGDAQRIFEPFFTTKTDGLGMGLSICKSIIESHGGRLLAASVPGQTTLSFVLPSDPGEPVSRSGALPN